jgi:hypothetical protein
VLKEADVKDRQVEFEMPEVAWAVSHVAITG